MNKVNMKTYIVEFIEHEQEEGQKMTIKTNDIKFTVEQIGRNRNLKEITYKEVRSINDE